MQTETPYMKPKEIKELLGINQRQFRALVQRKTFPTVRVGRDHRIPRDKFMAWIEAQCK